MDVRKSLLDVLGLHESASDVDSNDAWLGARQLWRVLRQGASSALVRSSAEVVERRLSAARKEWKAAKSRQADESVVAVRGLPSTEHFFSVASPGTPAGWDAASGRSGFAAGPCPVRCGQRCRTRSGWAQEAECVGLVRHLRQRGGVVSGLVWSLSERRAGPAGPGRGAVSRGARRCFGIVVGVSPQAVKATSGFGSAEVLSDRPGYCLPPGTNPMMRWNR